MAEPPSKRPPYQLLWNTAPNITVKMLVERRREYLRARQRLRSIWLEDKPMYYITVVQAKNGLSTS
ncbi:MAG TPA: hypothetical protein VK493_04745, partial [Bryobacteraceae bacterium]|nr:hypothetical protein [Bryobacteraceae bacterium]